MYIWCHKTDWSFTSVHNESDWSWSKHLINQFTHKALASASPQSTHAQIWFMKKHMQKYEIQFERSRNDQQPVTKIIYIWQENIILGFPCLMLT